MIEISSWPAMAFRRERLWHTLANKMKGFLLIDLSLAIDDALDLKRLLADRTIDNDGDEDFSKSRALVFRSKSRKCH